MNCACTGIRHCGLCEELDETKRRIEKFKRATIKPDIVTRQVYDPKRPQLDGITINCKATPHSTAPELFVL